MICNILYVLFLMIIYCITVILPLPSCAHIVFYCNMHLIISCLEVNMHASTVFFLCASKCLHNHAIQLSIATYKANEIPQQTKITLQNLTT